MFFFFYNLILLLLSPFLFIILLLKSIFKRKSLNFYLKRFYFRREFFDGEIKRTVHFHGVSVGEILSLKGLIERVRKKKCEISISVGTSAGYKIAEKKYSSFSARILPAPFELFFSVNKFLKNINPSVFIIAEAEFWFNLFYFLKKREVPIWIVNFRLGKPSVYKRFSFYYKKVFSLVDLFFVPEKRYVVFLKEFGVNSEKIILTGNLKADINFQRIPDDEMELLGEKFKRDNSRKLFVCGSTTEGEEVQILKIYEKFKKDWQLIIAPRHPERSDNILNLIKKNTSLKASLKTKLKESCDVLILNTIGELFSVYSIADLVFVGGSLMPVGGHNVLEPIFHKKPTITGPFYSNFKDIVDTLQNNEGIIIVKKAKEISEYLNMSERELYNRGEKGFEALKKMGGAIKIILQEFEKRIEC